MKWWSDEVMKSNQHYSLLTTHYSLLTTRYSLLTAHCSLLTAHYSLLTAHYPDPDPDLIQIWSDPDLILIWSNPDIDPIWFKQTEIQSNDGVGARWRVEFRNVIRCRRIRRKLTRETKQLTSFWFDSSAWCYSWWFIDANALPPRNYHPYEQGDAWAVK